MQSARPDMDLFTLALVSHMDTIPANMDLFALLGINNVDTMRERNIDKWLITAIRMLSRSLGAFNLVGIICVKVIVGRSFDIASRFPIQQFIQRHAIQRGECNKVIGIGRGFAALPFADSLAAYAKLSSKRLLRKPGSFATIDETLCHRKIHDSSFHAATVIE